MTITHTLGPGNGTVEVHTFRDGVARKMGHELLLSVDDWEATVSVDDAGAIEAMTFDTTPTALSVAKSVKGPKPLTDDDRGEIRGKIVKEVLGEDPISFRSNDISRDADSLTVRGDLTLAGTTKPAVFQLDAANGRVRGVLSVSQTEWGITPFSIMQGALKVGDTVEVSLDAALST